MLHRCWDWDVSLNIEETSRGDLVAAYVGQTSLKTQARVEETLGGVTYSLVDSLDTGGFGQEAIDTLLKLMEEHREDLVVIAAGYLDQMQMFLDSNPGLLSRFDVTDDFADYTDDELAPILDFIANANGVQISPEAHASALSNLPF